MTWRRLVPIAACLWLAAMPAWAAAGAASPDIDALLQRADTIKSSDHAAFLGILDQLAQRRGELDRRQQERLAYFQGWQDAYRSDFPAATARLTALADGASTLDIRFRANVTLVNVFEIARDYRRAYARMQQVLDMLPRVSDPAARVQALGVASESYAAAGQTDLALDYANRLIAEASNAHVTCKGLNHKQDAWYRGKRYADFLAGLQAAVDACTDAKETIYANGVRVRAAQIYLATGKPQDAIDLLLKYRAQAQATGYGELTSNFDAVLAGAYAHRNDMQAASRYATTALAESIKGQDTEGLAGAYYVLYSVAEQNGDAKAALDWYRKFVATNKSHLDDVSARALAYQMVHQQVEAKKAEVAELGQRNQLLLLRQTVDRKNLALVRLGIVLALVLAGSIALYAWRARRAQRKFQLLAQRDGLTGIHNRPHFIDCAQAELAYCRKSMREAGVIAIDLDHFKQINDTHGHAAGDAALKASVAACQKHLRSVDIFGRLGGEEFGIVLPDCVPEHAADLAEAMRREIAALQGTANGIPFPVTASFGVSSARKAGYELTALLAQADGALYQAKRSGRNKVVVHDDVGTAATPAARAVG